MLKIVSPNRNYRLNKTGKGLGFVWLPVGHAEIKDIPGMYAILSSAKISSILSPAAQEEAGLSPGFRRSLKKCEVRFENDPPRGSIAGLRREYISGLIRIFKEAGLYQNLEGAVTIEDNRFTAKPCPPCGGAPRRVCDILLCRSGWQGHSPMPGQIPRQLQRTG